MSLHEALAFAYSNNPELKAEQKNLESIHERMPQALSGFMPRASITYSRERENEKIGSATSESRNLPHSRSLNVTQPIFSGGGTIAATNRAENQIKAATEAYRNAEQSVLNEAVVAYMDTVRTREVFRLSLNNEKVLAEQLEATKNRFDLGETTKTDVAQSESRLARSTSDRVTAHGNMVSAESEFERVFGIKPPADMAMPASLPAIPENFKKALELALVNNPGMLSAKHNEKASSYGVDEQLATLLPTVNLVGSVVREGGTSARRGGSLESETVGVNVNVPLYQSGAEYSRIRQAKRTSESAYYNFLDTSNRTVDNVTEAWQQIQTAVSNVEANQSNVRAAEIALDGLKQERESGSRTTLDVLDGEQELFTARVDLETARRNKVVATYNLLAAIGELSAEDLGLEVDLYRPDEHYDSVKYKVIGF